MSIVAQLIAILLGTCLNLENSFVREKTDEEEEEEKN